MIFGLLNGKSGLFGFKQVTDKVLDEMTVLIPFILIESELPFENVVDSVAVIFGLKRSDILDELIDKHTEGPEVNPFIIASASEHFRSTVVGRASHREHLFAGSSMKALATAAKINQDGPLIFSIIQNVFRLDVSVTDVSLMNVL
jgi:hypothetical protein